MSTYRLLVCLAGSLTALHAGVGFASDNRDPSDPHAPVPHVTYHSVMSGYEHTGIARKPANWRELNERMERIGGPAGQLREPDEPIRKKMNEN